MTEFSWPIVHYFFMVLSRLSCASATVSCCHMTIIKVVIWQSSKSSCHHYVDSGGGGKGERKDRHHQLVVNKCHHTVFVSCKHGLIEYILWKYKERKDCGTELCTKFTHFKPSSAVDATIVHILSWLLLWLCFQWTPICIVLELAQCETKHIVLRYILVRL